MTMDGRDAHIEMTRTVRLPASQLADALVGLRREMTGRSQTFRLGERGTFELDAGLSPPRPVAPGASLVSIAIELRGRLWNPDGSAVTAVRLRAESDDAATIVVLVPSGEVAQWFRDHLAHYLDLAHAALDELCEELLFHAANQRRAREHA